MIFDATFIKRIAIGGVLAGLLVVGGLYWYGYNAAQRIKTSRKDAQRILSFITTGHPEIAYTFATKSLQGKLSKADFIAKLGPLSAKVPNFYPGKLDDTGSALTYTQKVDKLTAGANGKTEAIFTLQLVDDNGWKLDNIVVKQ